MRESSTSTVAPDRPGPLRKNPPGAMSYSVPRFRAYWLEGDRLIHNHYYEKRAAWMLRGAAILFGFGLTMQAQLPDFTPASPLIGALMHNDTAEAKRLLANGADPNAGKFVNAPPIFLAVNRGDVGLVRLMVEKGAKVKDVDGNGATTLMWAAGNETGDTSMVEYLIQQGVDPNAANKSGETALTWALRRGYPDVIAVLRKAGANETAMIRSSVEKSLALFTKSGPQFVRVSGCVSCHHQSLPQMALSLARKRGIPVDEQLAKQQTEATAALLNSAKEVVLQKKELIPDPAISVSYLLLGLAADKYPADEMTTNMTKLIASWQLADGSFPGLPMRPPIESNNITATALSLRALQVYGKESADRVRQARQWLIAAKPKNNEERAMQLLGLKWSDAPAAEVQNAAQELIASQRPDGGWGQLPGLESDSYATGQAMVALNWAGQMSTADPVYQRGISFLLRTQLSDGSWLVRTRSVPVQPYKESGFPHGPNQWISATGTSWAAMALTLALPANQQSSGL